MTRKEILQLKRVELTSGLRTITDVPTVVNYYESLLDRIRPLLVFISYQSNDSSPGGEMRFKYARGEAQAILREMEVEKW